MGIFYTYIFHIYNLNTVHDNSAPINQIVAILTASITNNDCKLCLTEYHFNTIYAGHEAHENGFLGHQILFLQNISTHFILPFS